jgi:hypothetical protein
MAFDPVSRTFYVGLNTGVIKRYLVNDSYTKILMLSDINVHTERVTGIVLDKRKKRLVLFNL